MFAQALTEIIRRLEEAKALGLVEQYALIGGFAVSWGGGRPCADDATLDGHPNAASDGGRNGYGFIGIAMRIPPMTSFIWKFCLGLSG